MSSTHKLSAGFSMAAAVFTSGGAGFESHLGLVVVLVDLDADGNESQSADAAARGFHYAGAFGVRDGTATVQIEPGFEAAMSYAGASFASLLGERLKKHQLK